jgi:hypothetical protein
MFLKSTIVAHASLRRCPDIADLITVSVSNVIGFSETFPRHTLKLVEQQAGYTLDLLCVPSVSVDVLGIRKTDGMHSKASRATGVLIRRLLECCTLSAIAPQQSAGRSFIGLGRKNREAE